MKTRLVWCIHIAAFVFSVMVLVLSAFSHYRTIWYRWSLTEKTFTMVGFLEGFVAVVRHSGPRHGEDGQLVYISSVPEKIDSLIEINEYRGGAVRRHDLLSVKHIELIFEGGTESFSLTAVPLRTFLFLPITWLCGFYLFKLRRRFRAARSDSPTH